MIAVINYGLGNLHSVQKAIAYIGGNVEVTDDPDTILKAQKVVLPGVGAFADGMAELKSRGLIPVVKAVASGTPLIGICLGMQLLFDSSEENGTHQGIGLLRGKVSAFIQPGIKIPQIGWNQLEISEFSCLMQNIQQGSYVYFNHSYYCVPENQSDILTTTMYGIRFASSIQRENVFGVQYHPEKSQKVGLQIIRNFLEQ